MTASTFAFSVCALLAYICLVDPNVLEYVSLLIRKLQISGSVIVYKVLWDPNLPWGRYRIRRVSSRNSDALAKSLRKELNLPEE